MAEVIFALACILALFALAMNRASLRVWAIAVAGFTLSAQMGLADGCSAGFSPGCSLSRVFRRSSATISCFPPIAR